MNKPIYRLPLFLTALLLVAPTLSSTLGAQQMSPNAHDPEAVFDSELPGNLVATEPPTAPATSNAADKTPPIPPASVKIPPMPRPLSTPPMPPSMDKDRGMVRLKENAKPRWPTPNGTPGSKTAPEESRQEASTQATDLVIASLNLEDSVGEVTIADMPVNDVLDMLQTLTGKAILRQSAISGTFTFRSEGQMTRREAVEAIASLLMLNGVAIIPMGDLYLKAVPATSAANHAPALIEDSTLHYEPSQVVCSKLFTVSFIPVSDAVTALSSMQSSLVGTAITGFEKNGSILATDSLINLQRMERLLNRIDNPADKEKLLCIPLHNVSANDAQSCFQQIISGAMADRFKDNTTVNADERTNQLIIVTKPANESLIRQLVDKLDTDVDPLTRTEMFSIRHADATDLCDVIKEVITGQQQVRDDTSTSKKSAAAQNLKQRSQQDTTTTATAGSQFSNYITIVPDERTNTIVATGTPTDIRLLGDIIDKLDAVLPQVRIEVVIAEVTLDKGQASGLSSFGIRYGSTAPDSSLSGDTTDGSNNTWLTPTFNTLNGISPLSVTPFTLDNFSMDAVLNIAKTNSNVKVVSAPTIVTTHNKEASIIVGSKEPVVSAYSTDTSTSTTDEDVTSISYEDVALELTVKPLIGSNGVIQMEVDQKVDEVTQRVTLAGYGDQPVIGTREATSFVSVANGKMVVLGGLQKDKTTTVRNKVFILGDIPLLGRLFRPKADEIERTELLIFIRPVLLANPEDANTDAQRLIEQNQSAKKINKYLREGNFRDPKETEAEEKEMK